MSLTGWFVRRWPRAEPPEPAGAAPAIRWVIVDLETSGLDPSRDVLLAIGAVAVHGDRVVVSDSLELGVRPEQTSSRPNILVHGIGEQAQRAGVSPASR